MSAGASSKPRAPRIYTVGHSTRTLEDLAALLHEVGVTVLADVRRFPGSRRHPWFNREALAERLPRDGIRYVWLGESLGGRKKESLPADRSPNGAWQVAAFRHYADAMTTPEFSAGVEALESLAREAATACACAERLWWQCHRRVLSDVMLVRGWEVVHLLDPGKSTRHELTEWARVDDGRLTYPSLL